MENITSPANPGRKKKKRSKKLRRWRNLFIDKFVDLVIVIVSILIAYELTVWQTEADHRSTENYYLESMVGDLEKDIDEINQNLEDLRYDSTVVANYVAHINEWPADSLGTVLVNVLSLETFTYNNNTYQSLVAGNGLNAFSDRAMRTQITEYYSLYVTIFRFEEIYTTLIFKINDYYVDNVDYIARKVIRKDDIDKLVSKNLLLLAGGQLEDAIEVYEEALVRANALKRGMESAF